MDSIFFSAVTVTALPCVVVSAAYYQAWRKAREIQSRHDRTMQSLREILADLRAINDRSEHDLAIRKQFMQRLNVARLKQRASHDVARPENGYEGGQGHVE